MMPILSYPFKSKWNVEHTYTNYSTGTAIFRMFYKAKGKLTNAHTGL